MTPIIRKLKILDGFDGLNQRRVDHGFARISATISTEKKSMGCHHSLNMRPPVPETLHQNGT